MIVLPTNTPIPMFSQALPTPTAQISNGFASINEFLSTYTTAKELALVFLSVIFGAICTVYINRRAIRQQCKFGLIHGMLVDVKKKVQSISNKINTIEIVLSFRRASIFDISDNIEECKNDLLYLNNDLTNQLPITYKYISASMVEKSTQSVSDYISLFFHIKNGNPMDLEMNDSFSLERLDELRNLCKGIRSLYNDFVIAEERLIMPGLFSFIMRKLRPIRRLLRQVWGIIFISKIHNIKD